MFSIFRCRIFFSLSLSIHLSFSNSSFLILLPQAEAGSGPFSCGGFWSHLSSRGWTLTQFPGTQLPSLHRLRSTLQLTTLPSVHPPTRGAGARRPPSCCRPGMGEGQGPADGCGCSWLTCLLTSGNGCLGKVLDFLVLLQKTLQKPGSFLNSNAKASSKPLFPCMSRNSQDQRQALIHTQQGLRA